MSTVTLLRVIGVCALFGALAFTGHYSIEGPVLLVMTFGFAVVFELLAVSKARTSPGAGIALAVAILAALGILAAMSLPASA
ncbi:MAG: hypothetical protein RBS05_21500 [Zoogloea oleivorans]|jgi:hypothetical protein|uniref:hypothetical protein n=1 Tax=Zoogloea oleivorans TaxID=1552750 RepID=UPI002A367E14|nr:hypothetical protein [Zoogloea oleivorans]MDY0038489.1 hypothetical protein [Zoogloea oleivorans]